MLDNAVSPTYHLYSYFASSCAARVTIAAHLKDLALEYHYLDMGKNEHQSETYREMNPSGTIPSMIVKTEGAKDFVLTQSMAMLEYIEETHPQPSPLLPSFEEPELRARVRELQNIITNDIFPPSNSRIASRVRAIRGERSDQISFVHAVMNEGFASYEIMLERYGGDYSVGNRVTLADVCLVPTLDLAKRYKFDLSPFPRTMAIYDRLMQLEAFQKGSWTSQQDTPLEHRLSEHNRSGPAAQ